MLENPFVLGVASLMVLLMVLAAWFPNQKWLEPFRSLRPPQRPARPQPTSSDPFPSAPVIAAAPVTAVHARIEARQRSFRRFSRIHAGVSIMLTGVVILFGHYAMAAMTASNPEEDPGRLLAVTFAAIFFIVGAAVIFTRGRDH